METIRISTPQNIDIDYEVAGLGERLVARLIDLGLFIAVFIGTFMIIGISAARLNNSGSALFVGIIMLIYAVLFVFYDLICEIFMNGQSLGKKVMKIKVISLDGAQPSVGQYLLRWLFRIVDFSLTLQVGALISVAVSENHQRIGDIVAGTTLIKTVPRTQIGQVSFLKYTEVYTPVFQEAAQLSEKDIALVQEVINTYTKTQNSVIVYNMAKRIREHLGVTQPIEMNNMKFLQTVISDYGHIVAHQDGMV